MIARIRGKIIQRNTNCLLIETGGLCYEVYLPQAVMQRIDDNVSTDKEVNLITFHYHQVEPSRSTPILIGFLNEVEKEFFQVFITVSGIGPRAALKAINQPISEIARAIDEADINFLRSLPGIGQQKARDIIAKLQNKVGKFGLLQDSSCKEPKSADQDDIVEEAMEVLTRLEYKKAEAAQMIKRALERSPDIAGAEQLLNEVYKQRKMA